MNGNTFSVPRIEQNRRDGFHENYSLRKIIHHENSHYNGKTFLKKISQLSNINDAIKYHSKNNYYNGVVIIMASRYNRAVGTYYAEIILSLEAYS